MEGHTIILLWQKRTSFMYIFLTHRKYFILCYKPQGRAGLAANKCEPKSLHKTWHSPVLYPGLDLNQRQNGLKHFAGRAWKHLEHLLLHNHLVHDCLEVAQGTDYVLLVLLQPTNLLEKQSSNTEQQLRIVQPNNFNDDYEHLTGFFKGPIL